MIEKRRINIYLPYRLSACKKNKYIGKCYSYNDNQMKFHWGNRAFYKTYVDFVEPEQVMLGAFK